MPNKKIYLSSPHIGAAERSYVADAFDTNWIAPLGPHVDAFEEALAKYVGTGHAAALSSGTAAIHLALVLLGVEAGDTVLCQSMTFSASANPILYQGARPVFIDSEADSWNMSPNVLEHALQKLTAKGQPPKAIIPVHLYGMPARMQEIMEIAERYGVPVIEDAAEALGSTCHGKKCGAFGQFGILSFNGNKIITTSGGGALIGNDEALIQKARFLATQARDPAPHYQHSQVGYNYRLSNVLAGIGRGQMEVLPQRIEQRRANYERYRNYFRKWNEQGYDIRFQEELPGLFSNRWLTCILVNPSNNNGLTREAIRLALEAGNIEARPLWKPMHLQPVFADASFFGGDTAENLFDMGLCLPSGSNLNEEDFRRIFALLDELLRK
ncbi:MAG: aminotransferase class I/II-fold pyridoxal phosphate-dependent enzyme [Lewinellaceae bacterium]|nr:aminotransferase class I/II-fold pyridoxal phosphate-dependent enzyme [Phaeodactylibacter sp.]MCB9036107.1 aminotransferase class I/II-fold pyridoxal phosphate-dependent enzyme [Lewinellaceae bacterium]